VLPLHALNRIDQIGDRFEAAWKSRARLRLESNLGDVAEAY
jgi:hypothetical protein